MSEFEVLYVWKLEVTFESRKILVHYISTSTMAIVVAKNSAQAWKNGACAVILITAITIVEVEIYGTRI